MSTNMPGVAFVTGAGGGIGGAAAERLAADGMAVAVTDARSDFAQATAKRISDAGGRALAIALDVTEPDSVAAAVVRTEAELGPIDRLVNSAGVFEWREAEDITDEAFRSMFEVHVFGMHAVCRAVLPDMLARGRGSIVNTTSIHAIRGQALASHYSAAKGAILSYTKALAREKSPRGIRVNAVAPGPTDTPLLRGSMDPREFDETVSERVKVIPMNRLATPREVAAGIAFLLSPDASYLTGHILTIDGGEVMS